MFGRRKRDDDSKPVEKTDGEVDFDVLLAQTVARHFDDSEVVDSTALIGLGGISIECTVSQLSPVPGGFAAALYFNLSGGGLGPQPVFASISGYAGTAAEAVVEGGCLWCCSFGTVLKSAFDGTHDAEVTVWEADVAGQTFQVHAGTLNRAFGQESATDVDAVIRAARADIGGDSDGLTSAVFESATLPVLPPNRATILSVFVMDASEQRTVEVKVNGRDWRPSTLHAFPASTGVAPAVTMLRDFAVLLPVGSPNPLTRDDIERTLSGLDPLHATPWDAEGWQGWAVHGGRLDPPLYEDAVASHEALSGPLPAEFKRFLLEIAGGGAGPGYGLLTPGEARDQLLPLAHAGCGVTWMLRLDTAHYGQVWVDAAGSDQTFSKVADSFSDWYRDWLSAVVSGGPWKQWDNAACATTSVLSQLMTSLDERGELGPPPVDLSGHIGTGAIALTVSDGFLPDGSAGDPCHPCVELASRFGLAPDVFRPGVLSRP